MKKGTRVAAKGPWFDSLPEVSAWIDTMDHPLTKQQMCTRCVEVWCKTNVAEAHDIAHDIGTEIMVIISWL